METRRLKNIVILILLLLNIFLMLLLGYQHLQSRRSHKEAMAQLQQLFSSAQIELAAQSDLSAAPLSPMTLIRNTESESMMASVFLGNDVPFFSQGGGIHSYTADNGTIHFRLGGSFDSSELHLPVDDISGYVQAFFRTFGYVQTSSPLSGSSGIVTAIQQISGIPILDCSIALEFADGVLIAVSGTYVSLENAADAEQGEQLSCITALVRFLDHLQDSGMISSRVEDVFCVYTLESTASDLRLLPTWQIETDTYTYLVDCFDGEIQRQN